MTFVWSFLDWSEIGLGPAMADMTEGGGLEVCLGAADCCNTPGGGREVWSTVGPGLVTGCVGSLMGGGGAVCLTTVVCCCCC